MILPDAELIVKTKYGSLNIVERITADNLLKKSEDYIKNYHILTDKGFRDIKSIERGSDWYASKLRFQMPGGERLYVKITQFSGVYNYETQEPIMNHKMKNDDCVVILQNLQFTCKGLEIKNNVGTVTDIGENFKYPRTVLIDFEGQYLCIDRVYQNPYRRV